MKWLTSLFKKKPAIVTVVIKDFYLHKPGYGRVRMYNGVLYVGERDRWMPVTWAYGPDFYAVGPEPEKNADGSVKLPRLWRGYE